MNRMKKKHGNKTAGSGTPARHCENCANLIPIGEGDHICDAEPGRMPLSEYLPTEDYLWCGGRQFCGK